MKVMLYTYCSIFKINPMEAQHTPIEQMTEMIQIHGEFEAFKAKEMEKQLRKK